MLTHLTNFISSYFSICLLSLLEQSVCLSFWISLLSHSLYLPLSLRKLTITHVGWASSACSYLKRPIFRPVCLQIGPCWAFGTFLINFTTIVIFQNCTFTTINQLFKKYFTNVFFLIISLQVGYSYQEGPLFCIVSLFWMYTKFPVYYVHLHSKMEHFNPDECRIYCTSAHERAQCVYSNYRLDRWVCVGLSWLATKLPQGRPEPSKLNVDSIVCFCGTHYQCWLEV